MAFDSENFHISIFSTVTNWQWKSDSSFLFPQKSLEFLLNNSSLLEKTLNFPKIIFYFLKKRETKEKIAGIPFPYYCWYGKHKQSHLLSTLKVYLFPLITEMTNHPRPSYQCETFLNQLSIMTLECLRPRRDCCPIKW